VEVGQFGIDAGAGQLRDTLRRLQRDLEGVDLIELSPVLIHRQQLGRNDADYALMLNICYLILTRCMPTEQRGYERVPDVDRDSLILHDIYERFVASFYKTHLGGWSVSSQQPLTWPAVKPSQFLPQMRADLVLEHCQSGRVVVLDTKFTASSLVGGQFGNVTFDPAHLYQIYAYLRSQEHKSQERATASGILLYPTVSQALSESIEIQGHRITFQTIDLSMQWQPIHDQLLAIFADQLGANG
jgi:5-methylcytosine-specific restriction enzyme subunit McrC